MRLVKTFMETFMSKKQKKSEENDQEQHEASPECETIVDQKQDETSPESENVIDLEQTILTEEDELQNEFDEYVREYNEGSQQTEEERVITAINSLSPLVATKVIEEMSAQQILDLISLKVDPNKVKEPTNNSFNN